jgi:hypothetical protein
MPRPRLSSKAWLVLGFIAFVFLGLVFLIARGLSGAGAERSAVTAVVRAEARGDTAAVLAAMPACAKEPACAAQVKARAGSLKRAGNVQILAYDPTVQVALEQLTGTGRVAWRAGTSLPVVQCVEAKRDGPLDGAGVELLSISAPIGRESACP